ncbi:hypothetical protein EW146_g1357 [Bondarzewia mesenterica]|uniref:RRM domain-containing protein n=1 Tax=Bondarzewia mesenterica TaxID=1095465 RepID=A0A4S4M479_9AGAM|nr:hypothetical protein EW146_g1357 [Bondarzewia mesenterica]
MLGAILVLTLLVLQIHATRPGSDNSQQSNFTIPDVVQAFDSAHIVPDILSSFDPTSILEVEFLDPDSSTNETSSVIPGVHLSMEQTLLEPQFFLTSNDTSLQNQTFVLALVDPDAPTPQNTSLSQFRHLLAGDFHLNGDSLDHALLTNSSAAQTDYVNPTPPVGSDPHRYVILLFIQPSNFDTLAANFVNASTPRSNFNLTTFANEVGLGSPIAGTYFLTQADDSSGANSSTSTASTAATSSSAGLNGASGSVIPSASPTVSNGIGMAGMMDTTLALIFAALLSKLPPGANRILFVKNLNYQITGEDLYDLFGRYGSIRQIRIGNEQKTKGTAFVVFDDVMDAKNALDHLNGFHLQERYIVVLYHMPAKQDAAAAKAELARREEELVQLKKKHDINDED